MEQNSKAADIIASLDAQLAGELWRAGDLTYKLHAEQLAIHQQIEEANASRFVLELARQFGKTNLSVTLATETCIRNPGCRVAYGAPTLKNLEEFILPTLELVCADAPPGLRGKFNSARSHWEFENDSHIHLFGCDDKHKANRGRGPKAARVVLDEAGFIPILDYVIESVVEPQLIHSGGDLILPSTPAEEPDHAFTRMAEIAEANGDYAKRTLYQNPLLSQERIEQIIDERARDAGMTPAQYVMTDHFRREYLAERVVNKLLVVVPEWEETRKTCLRAQERPEFFDGMTVLDFGGADPHFATFGYFDFKRAEYVIEDELMLRDGETTTDLANEIKKKELAVWGTDKWAGTIRGLEANPESMLLDQLPDYLRDAVNKKAPTQPHTRWCDTNTALARDLYVLHGVAFIPTRKDDLQLQVNALRVMVQSSKLVVHPRCVNLDRHLRTTTWANHKRRVFARRNGEHGDGVASLVYGVRNISPRNPYPPSWGSTAHQLLRGHVVDTPGARNAKALLGNSALARKLLGR